MANSDEQYTSSSTSRLGCTSPSKCSGNLYPSLVPAIAPVTAGVAASTSVAAANEGDVAPAATPSVTSKGLASKQGGPQDWNAAALARIIRGIPNTLAPFFQGMAPPHHNLMD